MCVTLSTLSEVRVSPPLLGLPRPQARPHHIGSVLMRPGGDQLGDETVERVGEVDVAGRHGGRMGGLAKIGNSVFDSCG